MCSITDTQIDHTGVPGALPYASVKSSNREEETVFWLCGQAKGKALDISYGVRNYV